MARKPMTPRVAVSAIFAIDGAALGGWMAHLPDAQQRLGLSAGALGVTILASSLGALSAMPFTGTLIHRFGSRRVSIVMAILLLCIVPLLMRAPSQLGLAALLYCMGAANGTLDVAMNAHSVAVQSQLTRPIMSSVHGWFCIGGFLGGAGTAMANKYGFAPSVHLIVASVVLGFVLLTVFRDLLPHDADQGEEGSRFVAPHGRLLAIGLITVLAFFAEGTLWDWSAVYFRTELGTSLDLAAWGFGVGAGSMAIGRLFGDPLVARLGPAASIRWCGLLASGGILLAVVLHSPSGTLISFGIAGAGLANAVPVLFTAAANLPGISSGAGLSAIACLGYTAFLGGPPLVGHIADATSLRVGFGLVGVLSTLLWLLGPRILEPRKSSGEG